MDIYDIQFLLWHDSSLYFGRKSLKRMDGSLSGTNALTTTTAKLAAVKNEDLNESENRKPRSSRPSRKRHQMLPNYNRIHGSAGRSRARDVGDSSLLVAPGPAVGRCGT
jgi:hypothetical protein